MIGLDLGVVPTLAGAPGTVPRTYINYVVADHISA